MSLYIPDLSHTHMLPACLFRKIVNFFHCLSVFSTILTAFSKVFSCFCKRPKIYLLFNFYGTRQSSLPKCLFCKTSMGIVPLTFQRLLELLKIWQLKIHFVSLNISIVMQHISRFYSLAITLAHVSEILWNFVQILLAFCRESTEDSKKENIQQGFCNKGSSSIGTFRLPITVNFSHKKGTKKKIWAVLENNNCVQ